jgi:hypothetical protein
MDPVVKNEAHQQHPKDLDGLIAGSSFLFLFRIFGSRRIRKPSGHTIDLQLAVFVV